MTKFGLLWLILGLILLCLIFMIGVAIRYERCYWRFMNIPHDAPKSWWLIVKSLAQRHTETERERLAYYNALYRRFKRTGPFCGYYALLQPRALILDRALIMRIMIKDFSNFNDRGLYCNRAQDPLSAHLYALPGSGWKEMRLKLEFSYEKAQMHWLFASIHAEALQLQRDVEQALAQQTHRTLHVQSLLERYVLGCLANSVYGLADEALRQRFPLTEFAQMAELAVAQPTHSYFMQFVLTRYPNTAQRLCLRTTPRNVERYFMQLITSVLEQRQQQRMRRQDYLQLLIDLHAQEQNTHAQAADMPDIKEHLDKELAAHAYLFLKACYKPTTTTLTCVLYELAQHPEIQWRVREEVQRALEASEYNLDFKCVQSLKLMGQVISETLRLHPVTPYLLRRTLNNYTVPEHANYMLSKQLFVVIPIHAIHNDPEYYPEPERFKPERFSGEQNRAREICTWFGFGVGARNCIGVHFAQLQMRLALAILLLHYEFSVSNQRPVIHCEDGITLQVTPLDEVEPGIDERAL